MKNVLNLVVLCVLLMSCGSARRSIPLVGERSITDPVLLQGRSVFDSNCHQCHPGGEGGLGFAINNKPLPNFLISFQVRHGIGAMPAFSEEMISDKELDALVTYLDWLQDLPQPEDAL